MSTISPVIVSMPDRRRTDEVRRRYQRLAPFYDAMEGLSERRFQPWRERLWSLVQGESVLEAGVGTGKNMPYYPPGAFMTAVDFTPGMLARARERARKLGINARLRLRLGDVQSLDFAEASFDAAAATFVFCSVPDPVLGLRELKRVVKPGGKIYLLEHMRSPQKLAGVLMDFFNPLAVRMMGANINRRTLDNVNSSGLEIEQVEDLGGGGIFKLIVVRVPGQTG